MCITGIDEAYGDTNRPFCLNFRFEIIKSRSHLPIQWTIDQVPVVQKLDSAIHPINRYPEDKYYEKRYPLDSNLYKWIGLSIFRTTGARTNREFNQW